MSVEVWFFRKLFRALQMQPICLRPVVYIANIYHQSGIDPIYNSLDMHDLYPDSNAPMLQPVSSSPAT